MVNKMLFNKGQLEFSYNNNDYIFNLNERTLIKNNKTRLKTLRSFTLVYTKSEDELTQKLYGILRDCQRFNRHVAETGRLLSEYERYFKMGIAFSNRVGYGLEEEIDILKEVPHSFILKHLKSQPDYENKKPYNIRELYQKEQMLINYPYLTDINIQRISNADLKTGLIQAKVFNNLNKSLINSGAKDMIDTAVYSSLSRDFIDAETWKMPVSYNFNTLLVEVARIERDLELYKDKEVNLKMKARLDKLPKFEDENYIIIYPQSVRDFQTERDHLRHCILSYIEKHALAQTTIAFVRSKKEPNKPLTTIEIKGNKLIQAKGKFNKEPNPEVIEFIRKYMNYIKG